uniref:ATP synthase complex subunit 8 n=1 Tax=Cucujoidea sp. 24 KM-2017 TaxID=2219361 RepID=A0A346RHV6_9CUCU|nr:ATP synthase F0 subunit 8 [Cucujoidea sp. 24 KM-2017]
MPQMAPMNWFMLFIFFIVLMFLINALNFSFNTPPIKKNTSSIKKLLTNWKW